MMRRHPAVHRGDDVRAAGLQAPGGAIGQPLGIGLSGDVGEHQRERLFEDVPHVQYTPVASIAACVQPASVSYAASARPGVALSLPPGSTGAAGGRGRSLFNYR